METTKNVMHFASETYDPRMLHQLKVVSISYLATLHISRI